MLGSPKRLVTRAIAMLMSDGRFVGVARNLKVDSDRQPGYLDDFE
jgi:hypothetical protein